MDVVGYNKQAWNGLVEKGDRWTVPLSDAEIDMARKGIIQLVLTPTLAVPVSWYPPLRNAKVLALASGGGQQVPALAAAGADVTVFDISEKQLQQDRLTCEKYDLKVDCILGDMMDMSVLPDTTFDLIFHPCSNAFIPALEQVWKSCYRVLKPGGVLMWGFTKAESMLLKHDKEAGSYELKYSMPYSDIHSLSDEERAVYTDVNEPLIFGHSLESQIGSLLREGFLLTDLFEDNWGGNDPLDAYFPAFVAARAIKKTTL